MRTEGRWGPSAAPGPPVLDPCHASSPDVSREVTHANLSTLRPAAEGQQPPARGRPAAASRHPASVASPVHGWAVPLRRTALRGGTRRHPTPQSVLRAGSSRLIACSVLRATHPQNQVAAHDPGGRKAQDQQRVGARLGQAMPRLRCSPRCRGARSIGPVGRLRHGAVSRPVDLVGLRTGRRRRPRSLARRRARARRWLTGRRWQGGHPRARRRWSLLRPARRGSRARVSTRLSRRRGAGLLGGRG